MSVWEVVASALIVVALSMALVFFTHCIHQEIRFRREERQERIIELPPSLDLPLTLPPPRQLPHRPAPMSTHPPPGCAVVEAPDQSLSLAHAV